MRYSDDFRRERNHEHWQNVRPIWNRLVDATKGDGLESDREIVWAVAKLFDLGSVTREDGTLEVVRTRGLPSDVVEWVGRVQCGETMPDRVRRNFVRQAKILFDSCERSYRETADKYRAMCIRDGVDFRDVLRMSRVAEPERS